MTPAEFVAPERARAIAGGAFVYAVVAGIFGFPRGQMPEGIGGLMSVFCLIVAGVAVAIRTARLSVDRRGVHWGWYGVGVRMPPARLRVARAWRDAISFVPVRGMPWTLVQRDWEPWGELASALERAGLPVERHDAPAPFRVRVHGYGRLLDLMVAESVLLASVFLLL